MRLEIGMSLPFMLLWKSLMHMAMAMAAEAAHQPFSIPIKISKQRKEAAFWAQIEHFKSLRRNPSEKHEGLSFHAGHWRKLGDMPLANCHLMMYTGEIGLGDPVQTFRVDIDTGSSDLWVVSSECDDTCDEYKGLNKYDSRASSAFEEAESSFKIDYVDGEEVSGHHARDSLTWAGSTVSNFTFAQVFHIEAYGMCVAEDGVLGLAFTSLSSHGLPSPIQQIVDSKVMTHNIFSLYLDTQDSYNEDILIEENITSKLISGGVDINLYDGCIAWHDVEMTLTLDGEELGFWEIALKSVGVVTKDGTVGNYNYSGIEDDNLAVVDSGSSFISGPSEVINEYLNEVDATCYAIEGYDVYVEVECRDTFFSGWDIAAVDCDTDIPNLVIDTGVINVTLSATNLVLEEVFEDNSIDTLEEVCILRLQTNPEFINGWILGIPFLEKYFAAFDQKKERVGFAPSLMNGSQRNEPICDEDSAINYSSNSSSEHSNTPTVERSVPTLTPTNAPNEKESLSTSPPTNAPTEVKTFPTSTPSLDKIASEGKEAVQAIIIGTISILILSFFIHRLIKKRRNQKASLREQRIPDFDLDENHEII